MPVHRQNTGPKQLFLDRRLGRKPDLEIVGAKDCGDELVQWLRHWTAKVNLPN